MREVAQSNVLDTNIYRSEPIDSTKTNSVETE